MLTISSTRKPPAMGADIELQLHAGLSSSSDRFETDDIALLAEAKSPERPSLHDDDQNLQKRANPVGNASIWSGFAYSLIAVITIANIVLLLGEIPWALFAEIGFDRISINLMLGFSVMILVSFLAHFIVFGTSSRRALLFVTILALIGFSVTGYITLGQISKLNKIIERNSTMDYKLISSIHQDYFNDTECRTKYVDFGDRMMPRWESKGEGYINHHCSTEARELYLVEFVKAKICILTLSLLIFLLCLIQYYTQKKQFGITRIMPVLSSLLFLALVVFLPESPSRLELFFQPYHKSYNTPTEPAHAKASARVPLIGLEDSVNDRIGQGKSQKSLDGTAGFSLGFEHIRPFPMDKQEIKVSRLIGFEDTQWFILNYKDKRFVILGSKNGQYPASIHLPNGIVVLVLSQEARKVLQNKNVFATIVSPDGSYFNIADSLWSDVLKVRGTVYDEQLPRVDFLSSNAVNLKDTISGEFIGSAILSIEDDTLFEKITSESVPGADAVTLYGLLYSSAYGYKLIDLPSYTHKSKTDKYRVCVYCLRTEIVQTGFIREAQSQLADAQNGVMRELLANTDLLNSFFLKFGRKLTRNTMFPHQVQAEQQINVVSDIGDQRSFDKDTLEAIFDKQIGGKLKNTWFKEESAKVLHEGETQPLVISDNKVYRINQDLFNTVINTQVNNFEPELQEILNGELDESDHGYDGLAVSRDDLSALFWDKKSTADLFIPAELDSASGAWPYYIAKVNGVVSKYYLNLVLIRKTLGLQPTIVPGYEDSPDPTTDLQTFVKANQGLILDQTTSGYETPEGDKPSITINNQKIELSAECLIALETLNVPGSFRAVSKSKKSRTHKKDDLSSQDVSIDLSSRRVFFPGPIEQAVKSGTLSKEIENRDFIYSCLHLSLTSNDPNQLRIFPLDNKPIIEGFCYGDMLNNSICNGTLSGVLILQNGVQLLHKMECKGQFSKGICNGDFYGLILINYTFFHLDHEGVYNLAEDTIFGKVTLKNQTENSSVSITCLNSFNIRTKVCSGAVITALKTTDTQLKATVTCSGDFYVETSDCKEGGYELISCDQPEVQESLNTCNGSYLHRKCKNGGRVSQCFSPDSEDIFQSCEGALWDGQTCRVKQTYIIADENNYFNGTCQGKYIENVYCEGNFIGGAIKCPSPVSPETLCEEPYWKTFTCEGKLTRNGCAGKLQYRTVINTSNYLVVYNTDRKTVVSPLAFEGPLGAEADLYYLKDQQDESTTLNGIVIKCYDQYNNEAKTCKNGLYSATYTEDQRTRKINVICKGTLNLIDLSCSDKLYTIFNCSTKMPNLQYPICAGDLDGIRCSNGGRFTECFGKSLDDSITTCRNGYWTGSVCKPKPLHIIINNAAYVTGTCDGVYTENESCDGTMQGSVVVCKPNLTPETLCKGPVIDKFTCVGMTTKYGCYGMYTGGTTLKNVDLKLETADSTNITLSKVTTNGIVNLNFAGYSPDADEHKGLKWAQVESVCSSAYNDKTKICTRADLKGTYEGLKHNKTHIEVDCQGDLDIDNLICLNGNYRLKVCKSKAKFQDMSLCIGYYNEIECAFGGNNTTCFNDAAATLNITCYTKYENGECEVPQVTLPTPPPVANETEPEEENYTLGIIQVNQTHWIKGSCNRKIENDTCHGKFVNGQFVSCSGDPKTNEGDFEACTTIESESIGNCTGVLNGTGCYGSYFHEFSSDKGRYRIAFEEGGHHYDFQTFDSSTIVTLVDGTEKASYICDVGLNAKTLNCPNGEGDIVLSQTETPGYSLGQHIRCQNDDFLILEKDCPSGTYITRTCHGRFHTLGVGIEMTCLGDFRKIHCSKGGKGVECHGGVAPDLNIYCENAYFDGTKCFGDHTGSNTVMNITRLANREVLDEFENTVQIAEFEVEKFTMYRADVLTASVSGSTVPKLIVKSADKTSEGFENIEVDAEPRSLSFEDGTLEKATFANFMLDELQFKDFTADDSCKYVHIVFKEMTITETIFKHLTSNNMNIKRLRTNDDLYTNLQVDNIETGLAYGHLIIKNVEIYLPYISQTTIDEWLSESGSQKTVNIELPKIEGAEVPPYHIHFRADASDIYLEFQEFTILNKPLETVEFEDYLLQSKSLVVKSSESD